MGLNFTHPLLPALFLAIVLTAACNDIGSQLAKHKPTPEFSLKNLQGRTVQFPQQFKDQVVIISFWADWCPSCKKEMRDFEGIYQQLKTQGLSIIAINIKQDRDTATAFIDELNLSYDVLLDTNGDIANKYSVSSLPVAFILNRNNNLETRVLGETPAEVFNKILRPLL